LKRGLLPAAVALALAAPALAQREPPRRAYANPSAGIAADIALAQLTGEKKGRWFALRKTAAPDAVMFVPQMVLAQPWLKSRSDAGPALKLDPYRAWSSCDGSLVVTSGLRQDGGSEGWYTTVWQRQADGSFLWVFDHGGPFRAPQGEPDMIEARVADCPAKRPAAPPAAGQRKPDSAPAVVFDPSSRSGHSRDGSLAWQVTAAPGGAHHFTASMLVDGAMQVFRDEKVAAAGS
jgi:hypothetical protein